MYQLLQARVPKTAQIRCRTAVQGKAYTHAVKSFFFFAELKDRRLRNLVAQDIVDSGEKRLPHITPVMCCDL